MTSVLFGNEDEPDARFVQLRDCRNMCVIEVNAMDVWMDQSQEQTDDRILVQRKTCPKCSTPVLRNLRYGSILNKIQMDIEQVKQRNTGTEVEKVQLQQDNKRDMLTLMHRDEARLDELLSKSQKKDLSVAEHRHTANRISLLLNIVKCKEDIRRHLSNELPTSGLGRLDLYLRRRVLPEEENDRNEPPDPSAAKLLRQLEKLRKWVLDHERIFSQQQAQECEQEIARIDLIAKSRILLKKAKHESKPEVCKLVETILGILESGEALTQDKEKQVSKKLKEARRMCGSLGINDEERRMILEAMNFNKGHWYKCPNGMW